MTAELALMRQTSVAGPLAGGGLVVMSVWRDLYEGALAPLIDLPGMCRIDMQPRSDSCRFRLVARGATVIERLSSLPVESAAIRWDERGGDQHDVNAHQHARFRVTSPERTVDVSIVIAVWRIVEMGLVRITAQAILSDAAAEPGAC
jgi:hypothetical protein